MISNPVIVIQYPEAAVLSASRLALTCSAPVDWKPGTPLLPHRPPYPTEDLIRQSGLFALMTAKSKNEADKPTEESNTEPIPTTATPSATTTAAASRRRKAGGDKAKLLDLDLNPDL